VRLALDGAVRSLLDVQRLAGEALLDLCRAVFADGAALHRVDCTLLHERAPPTVITLRFARAARSPRHMRDLLARRLENAKLAAGVCGLTLTAAETTRWRGAQSDLFEPVDPQHREAFAELVDRIAARLGWAAVQRPVLIDDYQPELAFRNVCAAEAGLATQPHAQAPSDGGRPSAGGAARPRASGGSPHHWMDRPTRLAAPRPIRVRTAAPGGLPGCFANGDDEHQITRAWGPERIETGWWRGPDVRRDYFRVATSGGGHAWIFHDVRRRTWFLHGWFE